MWSIGMSWRSGMRLPDPMGLKQKISSTPPILFGFSQRLGKRPRQEDFFLEDSGHIFALADGISGLPNGDVAAQLTVESAIWTINLLKKRHSYWRNKKLVGERVIHSTNTTVFNKRREKGFGLGMGSTLIVLLVSERNVYIYSVGDSGACRMREGALQMITNQDRDIEGYLVHAIGVEKKVPEYSFFTDVYTPGDTFLLATDGILDFVSEKNIFDVLGSSGITKETLTKSCETLLGIAEKNGSTDNMTASIIKYI